MIPKIEIRYSNIYNRIFNKNFSREDMIKLKENCKKFEELYKKYIKKILSLIEKYHMKQWKYNIAKTKILCNDMKKERKIG